MRHKVLHLFDDFEVGGDLASACEAGWMALARSSLETVELEFGLAF